MEFFLFLLLCAVNAQAQVTAIISPNQDYNAALDPNSNIRFNCTGNGSIISWTVDGAPSNNAMIISKGVTTTVAIDVGGGEFLSTLSIPASDQNNNNNTAIQCTVVDLDSIPIASVMSKLIFFKIQGLLGRPPNLTLSEDDEQLTRLLTWDAPETLDITDVDPDIESYQVCYNLSAELTCINVSCEGERVLKFANVHIPLLFTVTAFNVVGEGSDSSIVHQASNCNSIGVFTSISDIQTRVSLTQSGLVVMLLFNQIRENPVLCFSVYGIETVLVLGSSTVTTEYRQQIPIVEKHSCDSVQLSLTINSDLVDNELYTANITTTNSNGVVMLIGSVEFSTYDVQSVNVSALSGGLELSCTFVSGSQALGCQLTVCRVENDNIVEQACILTTINKTSDSLTSSKQVTNVEVGSYKIIQIAEVERDGQVNLVRCIDALKVNIIANFIATTSTSVLVTTAKGDSAVYAIGAIIGVCLGIAAILLFVTSVIVTVVVVAYKCYLKRKITQVVYDEPSSVSQTAPPVQLELEQCPAYGVFNKR